MSVRQQINCFGNPNSSTYLANPQVHHARLSLFSQVSRNPTQTSLSGGRQTVLAVADARPTETSLTHQETVMTTLRDKRLAEYEGKLKRQEQPSLSAPTRFAKVDGTTRIGRPDASSNNDVLRNVWCSAHHIGWQFKSLGPRPT